MVRREAFFNKIRDLGYAYKTTKNRVTIWRKTGSTHFISVPKADLLEDLYVRSALRQAGEPEADIRSFIASHSV
jgi:hypothetical protein